jgi:hypothetical protein
MYATFPNNITDYTETNAETWEEQQPEWLTFEKRSTSSMYYIYYARMDQAKKSACT